MFMFSSSLCFPQLMFQQVVKFEITDIYHVQAHSDNQ